MFRQPKPLTGILAIDDFRAAWIANVPALELTRRCDISLPLVYRAAKELGLPLRGNFPGAKWTPGRDDTLRKLWAEGLSTNAIAAQLGISKNSAIGRAHRLHLPSRGSPLMPPRPKPTAITAHQASPAIEPSTRRMPLPPAKARPDLYPSAMTCQFPSWPHDAGQGHPEFGTFCGDTRDPGSAYCLTHRRLCYSTRVALASMPLDAKDAAA